MIDKKRHQLPTRGGNVAHLFHISPDGLHGHCDEADDGVGESEVENQEVNICATLHLVPAIY